MRKVLFGFVWLVVIYMVGSMILGGVVGFRVGLKYPNDPNRAAAEAPMAAEEAVKKNLPMLVGGSITLAILGSAFGVLPGTRSRRRREFNEADMTPDEFAQHASAQYQR